MTETSERVYNNFEQSFKEFREATELTKQTKAQKLSSQIDLLSRTSKGLEFLYNHSLELEKAGIFDGTAWNQPHKQVPTLVKGTLMAGHPTSSFEILSELRMLSYANGNRGNSEVSAEEATTFLEEVVVLNLEFAFDELTEESRSKLTQQERRKVVNHFQFLMDKAELTGIKEKLAEEIRLVVEQRPVVTTTVRNLIQTVYHKMKLDEDDPVDQRLLHFVNAVYFPGPLVGDHPNYENYKETIVQAEKETLEKEAVSMGEFLHDTGLTNPYLAILLCHLVKEQPSLVSVALKLNGKGRSEWERYQEFTTNLVVDNFSENHYRGIYGLKRMLERNLFSRRPVRAGLTNLKLVNIHPGVEKRILRSVIEPRGEVSARNYLMGALISILGQPIGIGQGNNATCQSARGISMWAQHAPAKLINMITTVATANNLIMRFENQDLESMKLGKGLVDKLDHKLDAVSVMLVPHLDKIYNEMMRRASGRGEDPHKWTNPALYGHWIPTGFASAYSYLTNSIQDFEGFVKLFYASFHPKYNGGHEMVYPNPVGIFITSSKGDMLGFHAVSLLRVTENKEKPGEIRAYFLNPNNEGRQDWGQNIKPSVFKNGERHGESSLPVHEFMARTYAFHFDSLAAKEHLEEVPVKEIDKVETLAKESWGQAYQWSNIKKLW